MTKSGRVVAWIAGGACAACCAVPVVAMVSGAAGLAGLGIYMEVGAWVGLASAVIALLVWRIRKRSAPTCRIDGSCGPS